LFRPLLRLRLGLLLLLLLLLLRLLLLRLLLLRLQLPLLLVMLLRLLLLRLLLLLLLPQLTMPFPGTVGRSHIAACVCWCLGIAPPLLQTVLAFTLARASLRQ